MKMLPPTPSACLKILCVCLTLISALSATLSACAQTTPAYENPAAPLEPRVNDLFGRLTQAEKLSLLSGTGFTTQPIPRLGVPAMAMADGPQGVRGGMSATLGPSTLFPPGVTEASTWDPDLVAQVGRAIGEEAKNKGTGVQIMLGPDINIHRSPLGGRDGESFTEDPFLNAQLAVAYIDGMQSSGVGACVKHFVCNNEEVDRGYVNVHVDQRALHEIYLPGFEAAVTQGHAWTLMDAYNMVNGYHMSANRFLLTDVLKRSWGWDGLVMSDWGAVHETAGVVNAGNDLEMPGGGYLTPNNVAPVLASGQVTQAEIDDSVHRILRAVIRTGLLDGPMHPDSNVVGSDAHTRLAYTVAANGIILLKNAKGVLPLDTAKIHSIALIGPRVKQWQMGAQGSPGVNPIHSVTAFDAIQQEAGPSVRLNYAEGIGLNEDAGEFVPTSAVTPAQAAPGQHGWSAEYFGNANLQGPPALTRVDPVISFNWPTSGPGAGIAQTNFSARWTGTVVAPTTGSYAFHLRADDGVRMYVDGKMVIDSWVPSGGDVRYATVDMVAGKSYNIRVEYFQATGDAFVSLKWSPPGTNDFADAVDAAKRSDVAVVFVGTTHEGEGEDRPSMDLPNGQDGLIKAVAAANRHTIVVLNNGTPVAMTQWIRHVCGVVEAWFPGEEGGAALADILFGKVNPSGKLPDTLGVRREDYPDYGNFPGTNGQVNYAEGIYVGYRHFDKAGIAPLFPFGYGLSYTRFRYSNMKLSSLNLTPDGTVTATVSVTNIGHREGAEVVELYVHDPSPKIDKPIRELKGFARVDLLPGQTKTVSLPLDPRALAYCDTAGAQWKADAGTYDVEIGASSRAIRLTAPLRLTSTYIQPIPELQGLK